MTDFIFITTSDIHISDNGPEGRIDDFKSTILNKISQMRMACNKLNADGAIIAGDLFNLKNPSKNSHQLNIELIKEFKQFTCPIYMIEGNHDLTADRLESIETQPLGVLFADGTLKQLRNEIITKNDIKISLVGIPYSDGLDLSALKFPEKEDTIARICAMHLYAGLKPGRLFKERLYGYDELSQLPADIYILGHYHVDQGIYEQDGKYFINLGAMSRGTSSEENINHQPQIGFIKIEVDDDGKPKYTIRSIKLKIKPAGEVFDLVKKEALQKESEEIKEFVEKLIAETIMNPKDTAKNIDEILEKMDLAKTVRDKVLYFIQEATK